MTRRPYTWTVTTVRYHGSKTAEHGDGWTLIGECDCEKCRAEWRAGNNDHSRAELVNYERGRRLTCVRDASYTVTDTTTHTIPAPEEPAHA